VDGTTSTALLPSSKSRTYGDEFDDIPGTIAMSQPDGHAIFARPGFFEAPSFFNAPAPGGPLVDGVGKLNTLGYATLLHEVLHKFADHERMRLALGIDQFTFNIAGSSIISRRLAEKCW
jgi:hypothetical protein